MIDQTNMKCTLVGIAQFEPLNVMLELINIASANTIFYLFGSLTSEIDISQCWFGQSGRECSTNKEITMHHVLPSGGLKVG